MDASPGTLGGSSALRPVDWSRFQCVELYAQHGAKCLGGDFFDALSMGDRILFLLTDIAGPRVEALVAGLEVQNTFRQTAQELFKDSAVNDSDTMAALAHAVNLALIAAARRVRIAPTFLGCFHGSLGVLTYCNAGNLLALYRDAENVRVLQSGGMPLGLFTHTTFEAAVLAFQQGDALLLVTKGVTESRRGSVEFGAERVEKLLRDSNPLSASGICETVLREAHDHAKRGDHDDLTALAMVRREHPA